MQKTVVNLEIVLAVVLDKDQILLTVRHESKLAGGFLKKELPGGKVEKGEKLEEAIVREVFEETGWEVKIKRKLPLIFTHDWEYPDKIQHTIMHGFECLPIKKSNKKYEIYKESQWFEINKALKLDLMPGVKEFIKLR